MVISRGTMSFISQNTSNSSTNVRQVLTEAHLNHLSLKTQISLLVAERTSQIRQNDNK